MKYKIQLAAYNISSEILNRILSYVPSKYLYIISREEMRELMYGTGNAMKVFYNGSDQLIVPDRVLDHVLGDRNIFKPSRNGSHQVILYVRQGQDVLVQHTLTGCRADRRMRKLLNKAGYSKDDINAQLDKYKSEYNPEQKQLHYLKQFNDGQIHKYTNCAEFDINSAYCSILVTIFPKAKELLNKAYEERKIHPENKAMFNYFVGMLARKGHRETYNYIVQSVTNKLNSFIEAHGGWDYVIYANTDGVIMKLIDNMTYNTSHALGDFKLEVQGDCYTYRGSNYNLFQIGDKLKGNMLYGARKETNLAYGVVTEYTRTEHTKASDLHKDKYARWFTAEEIKQQFKKIVTEEINNEQKHSDKKILQQETKQDNNLQLPKKQIFSAEVYEWYQRYQQNTRFNRQAGRSKKESCQQGN